MPILTPDFSQAIEMGPIDPNTYSAKVTAFEQQTSKSGNPMLMGSVELMVDGKPRQRRVYWVTSGAGAGSFKQYLRAIGRNDLAEGGKPVDTDEIINIEFMAVVDKDTYDGKPTDKIVNCLKA